MTQGPSKPEAAAPATQAAQAGPTGTSTIRLQRVLRAPAERIYRAFLEAGALERFLPPHGFLGKVHRIDARVGGGYRMSFTNFGSGTSHSFETRFVELVPNRRIVKSDRFDEPGPSGEMTTAVELRPVSCGTDLSITQSGIPAMIPPEMCHLGWQETLLQLAHLVEPEIPDKTSPMDVAP